MVTVKKLSVESFRSHTKKTITLNKKTTIILGKNGVGKTSLLEAIYLSLQGKSFKGSDDEILKNSKKWWKISLELSDLSKRQVTYSNKKGIKQKEFIINDNKVKRLSYKNKLPIVLFEPDDLQLLHGSPSRRRLFIDTLISQLDPLYASILRKYDRALSQRNSLLKQGVRDPLYYFAWNITLSEYGASIIARRERIINKINQELTNTYQHIAENNDSLLIKTNYLEREHTSQKILNDLESSFEKDILVKHTTIGPHRHDVIFLFNNLPAVMSSRGETRTIVLSLKFIEARIIESITGIKPLILLDDVYSELDSKRQNQLTQYDNQYIITTTHPPEDVKNKKIITLS